MQIYVYVYREKHSAGGIWLSSARVRKDDEVQAVFWFPTGSNQSVCGGGVLLLNLQRELQQQLRIFQQLLVEQVVIQLHQD